MITEKKIYELKLGVDATKIVVRPNGDDEVIVNLGLDEFEIILTTDEALDLARALRGVCEK